MPIIEVARSEEQRNAVYRFRYEVYVEELGKRPPCADHDRRTLREELDGTGVVFFAEQDGRVVATFRTNYLSDGPLPPNVDRALAIDQFLEGFPRSSLCFTSRLMVHPAFRRSALAWRMVATAYRDARLRGVRFGFIHTSADLLHFYEQLGYRRYARPFDDGVAGLQVPQVIVAEDVHHLRACRSPFLRIAEVFDNSTSAAAWFSRHFQSPAREPLPAG